MIGKFSLSNSRYDFSKSSFVNVARRILSSSSSCKILSVEFDIFSSPNYLKFTATIKSPRSMNNTPIIVYPTLLFLFTSMGFSSFTKCFEGKDLS